MKVNLNKMKRILLSLLMCFTLNAAENNTQYYYDWSYLLFNSPDFIEACEIGCMGRDITAAIADKIDKAHIKFEGKLGKIRMVYIDELEFLDPRLDITGLMFDEICKG
jgi:hypothetical protein